MKCNEAVGVMELHLAGELSPEQDELVMSHCESCRPCADYRDRTESFLRSMDHGFKRLNPASELEEKILRRIEGTVVAVPGRGHGFRRLAWAAMAAGLLLTAVIFYAFTRVPSLSAPRLSAVILSSSQVNLAWSRGPKAAERFAIERSDDGHRFSEIARVPGDRLEYKDPEILEGKTVHYRVRTLAAGTDSDYSNVVTATLSSRPFSNFSTRGYVGKKPNELVAGFIIGGHEPKKVVLRAWGPTLADHGVSDPLYNPSISLYTQGRKIARNDDWQVPDPLGEQNGYRCGSVEEIKSRISGLNGTGGEREAVLIITLPPGTYTANVESSDEGSGTALVEVNEIVQ